MCSIYASAKNGWIWGVSVCHSNSDIQYFRLISIPLMASGTAMTRVPGPDTALWETRKTQLLGQLMCEGSNAKTLENFTTCTIIQYIESV